jgi:hypothetical protein
VVIKNPSSIRRSNRSSKTLSTPSQLPLVPAAAVRAIRAASPFAVVAQGWPPIVLNHARSVSS